MRKSTIIANCLVNSHMVARLDDAERAVHDIFIECFPGADFHDWNDNVNDDVAKNIIRTVGRASRINVESFIRDLWD